MRILFFTAMYGRRSTELWVLCLRRLQKEFDIEPFAVISGRDAEELCQREKIDYVVAPNSPLGAKHNTGLQAALERKSWDVLIHLGDDDSISNEGVRALLSYHSQGYNHVGFKDIVFLDTITGENWYMSYKEQSDKLFGAGRLFDRGMLENWAMSARIRLKVPFNFGGFDLSRALAGSIVEFPVGVARYLVGRDWFEYTDSPNRVGLWQPELERSLDGSSEMRLVKHGQLPKALKSSRHNVIDVKTESQKWAMAHFKNQQIPMAKTEFEEATWFLGNPEIDFIKSL